MHRGESPRRHLRAIALGGLLAALCAGSGLRFAGTRLLFADGPGTAVASPAGAPTGETPWRYRYGSTDVRLDLDAASAVVRLAGDGTGHDETLARLTADSETFLPATARDALRYPGLFPLRFRPVVPAADRLIAIRALEFDPAVVFATATFRHGDARLYPRPEIWVVLDPAEPHSALASLAQEGDVTPLRAVRALTPTWLVAFEGSPLDTFERARELARLPGVRHAQPNFIRKLEAHAAPNDPLFPGQWDLLNTGQYGGTPGADIRATAAWDITTGSPDVTIAIIDEGVDLTHPDLAANLLPGFDAVVGSPTPSGVPGSAHPSDPHGTACAGIAAAVGDNATGISGVCPGARILPVRIGFGSLWSQDDWVVDGITWAVDQGADVLSNSWGGGPPSVIEQNAISYAVVLGRGGLGSAVLFSSGNDDSGTVAFPAAYPEAIAVGASSPCDERKSASSCDGEWWWGSQYGAGLELVAPGPKVTTTDIAGPSGFGPGDYTEFSGTSSACPHVAGALGLLLSVEPMLTQVELRQLLASSARDGVGVPAEDTPGWDPYMGWGRLDALELLVQSGAGVAPPQSVTCDTNGMDVTLTWSNGEAYQSVQVTRDGATIANLAGNTTGFIDIGAPTGFHQYAVRGVLGGTPSPRTPCTVLVVGQPTDLVWSPAGGAVDGGSAIANALLAVGRQPIVVDVLADAGALSQYETVWVNLGIFPAKHVLTASQGAALADYLLGANSLDPRRLYLEGGDTWFFDPSTAVHDLFGLDAVSDGGQSGDLSQVSGVPAFGCDLSTLTFDYIGEDQWIDHLAPQPGSETVLRNLSPLFDVAVHRDSGNFATIGASFELAGLAEGIDSRNDLIEAILICWNVSFVPNPAPDPMLQLDCTPGTGTVILSWLLGDSYDSIEVARNGVPIAMLDGTATGYVDPSPQPGLGVYEVRGTSAGLESTPRTCTLTLDPPQNVLRIGTASASPGQTFEIEVTADHELPLEGYAFPLVFDPSAMRIDGFTVVGTALESFTLQIFAPVVDNVAGFATITAMIDASPPITEALPVGLDQPILRIQGTVLPGAQAGTTVPVEVPETLGPTGVVAAFIENGGIGYPPDRIDGSLTIDPTTTLRLRVGSRPGTAGGTVSQPIVLDTDRALLGFGLGVAYDTSALDAVTVELGPDVPVADFFDSDIDDALGEITVSTILDVAPPIDQQIDPGLDHEVLDITWSIGSTVPDGAILELLIEDGLGNPPQSVHFLDVLGTTWVPDTFPGFIFVSASTPMFIRGDANVDATLSLADPVVVLEGLFNQGQLACADAADSNDDGAIDISDAVELLSHLFAGGATPLPMPFPDAGEDPTDGDPLDCATGL